PTIRNKGPHALEKRADTYFREGEIGKLLYTPSSHCPNAHTKEHRKNDVSTNSLGGGSLRVVHKALRREAWHGRSKGKEAADCFDHVNSSSRMVSLKERPLSRMRRAARLEGLCWTQTPPPPHTSVGEQILEA
ncbi:unnamed protein product, partial [Ectocarpus sp. 8 AP-2014]